MGNDWLRGAAQPVPPSGYHCDPKEPLPFLALASQKVDIGVYHMGISADPKLLAWFTAAHAQASARKLDLSARRSATPQIRREAKPHVPRTIMHLRGPGTLRPAKPAAAIVTP